MVYHLVTAVIIISIVTALFFIVFTPKTSSSLNTIGIYTITVAAFEVLANFTAGNGNNNLYLLPIYTIIEFIQLTIFFFLYLKLARPWYLFILVGAALILVNTIFFQGIEIYNSYAKASVYVIILGLGVGTLFYIIKLELFDHVDISVKFVLFGILINFSGSFALYLFSNFITGLSIEVQKSLWLINIVLNFLAQVLYLKAFYRFRKYSLLHA